MDFMTMIWIFIGIGVLSTIGQIMNTHNRVSQGATLQQNFVSLGNMRGKTLEEITAIVGSPNGMTNMEPMGIIYNWSAHGYSISILFTNGVCDQILNEFAG